MSEQKTPQFKDAAQLTDWTKLALYANVVIGVVAIVSNLMEYQMISDFQNGVFASDEMAAAAGDKSDARQGLIGITQLTLFFVTGILILMWIYRVNANARALGAIEMEYTPGWSVGWYFIPFANLVKPYSAMKEIWKASANPKDWSTQSVPSLLPCWWFFWIVSNAIGRVSYKLSTKAEGINDFITANFVSQAAEIIDIPLCLVLIAIVKKVQEMQTTHKKFHAPNHLPENPVNRIKP